MANKPDSISSATASNHDEVAGELFSNRIAKESPLKDAAFNTSKAGAIAAKPQSKMFPWKMLLIIAAALILGGLLLLLGWMYVAGKNQKQRNLANQFNTTPLDLSSLNSGSLGGNSTVLLNGALIVNGPVTAQSFSGNGANLSNVDATKLNHQPGSFYQDASNLDSGTLNDARLSGNVVLLGSSPNFTNLLVTGTTTLQGPATLQNTLAVSGAATFQTTVDVGGDLTVTGDTNINGLTYNWPGTQASGVLSNDGAGNLAWQPVGACASCITDGGNAFGASISVGTNDANSLLLKTNGSTQVTVNTAGDVGIGTSPGYKLDVNGDVNVAAGNAFRIGGTAICTSGGCAASAGSTDYVQNSASLQTGVNFNFEIASVNSVGGIIRAKVGQVSDLQQWQSSGGVALAYVDAAGDFSANSALKINGVTVCTASGCTAAGGSGVYIQNGTGLQATANFNIQSAAAGSIGGVIRGAAGQTANLQEWQDSTGFVVASIESNGTLTVNESGVGGSFLAATEFYMSNSNYWSDITPSGFMTGSLSDSTGTQIVPTGIYFYSSTGQASVIQLTASHVLETDLNTRLNVRKTLAVNSTGALGTVEKFRVNTPTTTDNTAASIFATGAAANKGMVVQGAASQSADLQQWQDSVGAVLAKVTSIGDFTLNHTGNNLLTINSSNSGSAGIQFSVAGTGPKLISDPVNGALVTLQGGAEKMRLTSGGVLEINSTGTPGTVEKFRVNTPTTSDNSANAIITTSATTSKGLVVQGLASQTANLQEWQSSTGTALLSVQSNGSIYSPSAPIKLGFNQAIQGEYSGGGVFYDLIKLGASNDIRVGGASRDIHVQGLNYTFLETASSSLTFYAGGLYPTTGTAGVLGTASNPWVQLRLASNSASVTPLYVKAYTGQTANLTEWQNSTGAILSGVNASGNLFLGRASGATGSAILYNSAGAGSITLTGADPGASAFTITFPAETGTVCTTASAGACTSAGGFVQLQASTPGTQQTGNLNVSGVAIAGTGVGVGTNPAQSGDIRLPYNGAIKMRDTSNTADYNLITYASGLITVGGTGTSGIVLNGNGHYVNVNSGGLGANTTTFGTVEKFGVNTATTVDNAAAAIISTGAAANKGLVIQGAASQTANLTQWQDSTGTVLTSVDSTGKILFGSTGSVNLYSASSTYLKSDNAIWSAAALSFLGSGRAQFGTIAGSLPGMLFVSTNTSATVGAVIRGVASQSANLQEWQDSTGAILASVLPNGRLTIGGTGQAVLSPQNAGSLYLRANSGTVAIGDAGTTGVQIVANGGTLRVNTPTTADAAALSLFATGGTANKGLVIQGVAGQTANLQEWQDSTGAVLAKVDASGNLSIGATAASAGAIRLQNAASLQFRNGANTGDINAIRTDASDNLLINGGNGSTGVVALQNNGISYLTVGASAASRVNIASGNTFLSDFVRVSSTTGSLGTVEKFRVNSPTTGDNLANAIFSASAATSKALVIQGAASQSANLQEWQNSSGVALSNITSGGDLQFGKETAHSITLADSTTANTAGAALSITSAAGNGTAGGGALNLTAGAAGATAGVAGAVNITGGLSTGVTQGGNVNLVGGGGLTGGNVVLNGGNGVGVGSVILANTRGSVGIGTSLSTTTINNSGARLLVSTGATGTIGQIIRGIASQTADLLQIQTSTPTSVLTVSASGAFLSQNTTNSTAAFTVRDQGGTNNVLSVDTTNNRVAIGTGTAAPTATLDVLSAGADGTTVAQFKNAGATSCTVQPGGTGFACSSDARLKTNIMNLDSANASDIVSKLQGVSFNWITSPDGQTQDGFIAQDLQKLIPSAVSVGPNGYLVANYTAIIPYLVEAFKKQQSDIDTLKDSQSGTSIDVLKTLADAKAVTLSGDLTVGGNVVVSGRTETSSDNKGSISIPAGQTSVTVSLPSTFSKKPNINLTPGDFIDGQYRVTGVTKTGFTIELQKAQTNAVNFDWQAL